MVATKTSKSLEDELDAAIFAAGKVWSNLRRLWSNAKHGARDAEITRLKARMKDAKEDVDDEQALPASAPCTPVGAKKAFCTSVCKVFLQENILFDCLFTCLRAGRQ